ncbi:MAG TPA: hypothetical protein ENN84_01955, partial [Candidatus Marinimicrobia bacterium]|nr:hypothetical protein [Candidatus Neomarinimicrobiota bacterium]
MRILKIRFKNLNSLTGEWELDLTVSEFTYDGIFAIIGRTGAGKSTILDAICLALYGRTPRLGKVTKGSNEIMSRRTGECFAELEFESNAKPYRCNWSQRRAYGKAEGELQAPLHTISDIETEKILENRLSEVPNYVEALTGMDFHRFTRSMLLAQGAFAVFLQASGSERAPILEQITGTEIYGVISSAVYERHQQEELMARQLESELAMIDIFTDEQINQIQEQITERQKIILSLKEKIQSISIQKQWQEKIRDLEKELENIAYEKIKLQSETEAFAPEIDRLKLAEKAAELDPAYVSLQASRRASGQEKKQLSSLQPQFDEARAAAQKAAEKRQKTEQKRLAAQEAIRVAAPLIRQAREMDLLLSEKEKNISERRNDLKKDEKKYTSLEKQLQQIEMRQMENENKKEKLREFLIEKKADEWLVSNLSAISEQCRQLQKLSFQQRDLEIKISAEEGNLQELANALAKKQKQETAHRNIHNETQDKLLKIRETLLGKLAGKLLQEYESELRSLEKERSRQELIASFDNHREKLEPGQPCPLCGSEKHPWAQGNKPESTAIQQEIDILENFIMESHTLEKDLEILEIKERQDLENFLKSERERQEAENQFLQKKASLENEKKATEQLKEQIYELESTLQSRLMPYQIGIIQNEQAELLIQKLEQRLQQYQSRQQELSSLENQRRELCLENESLKKNLDELNSRIIEKKAYLQIAVSEIEGIKAQRKLLFENKNPDIIESHLHKDAENAEKELKAARK